MSKRTKEVKATPLKQRDLLICVYCHRGTMHCKSITFFRIRLTRYMVDLPAVRRQNGLEQMIGAVASIMGADEDIAVPVGDSLDVHVCDTCAGEAVAAIYEFAQEAAGMTP